MSSPPDKQTLYDRIDHLASLEVPDSTVSVPLEELAVLLAFMRRDEAFKMAEPHEPIVAATNAVTEAAATAKADNFTVERVGQNYLNVIHDGSIIAGFSTDYHDDGEALLYQACAESPLVTYRGYADPDVDTQLDWTGRLTDSTLTEQ